MTSKPSRLARLFRDVHSNPVFGPQTLPRLVINSAKAACFVHLFTEYIGELRMTWGPSMLPTLGPRGDWVYISKLSRRGKDVRVGDMVAVKHPMFPGTGAIKRVVGLSGDFVLRDTPGTVSDAMIQVPEGHCWIIGDNVPWSRDSRTYGPLPLALIKGKVVAKVWPLRQMKWIENSFQPVEADIA